MTNTLDDLLYLDNTVIDQEQGCWVKIEAKLTRKTTKERPHGIRYSLTLHAPDGARILGYDNAHPIKSKKGKYQATRYIEYDHKHRSPQDKGLPYHFTNAQQLLVDFWADVDAILKKQLKNK